MNNFYDLHLIPIIELILAENPNLQTMSEAVMLIIVIEIRTIQNF